MKFLACVLIIFLKVPNCFGQAADQKQLLQEAESARTARLVLGSTVAVLGAGAIVGGAIMRSGGTTVRRDMGTYFVLTPGILIALSSLFFFLDTWDAEDRFHQAHKESSMNLLPQISLDKNEVSFGLLTKLDF